MEAHEGTDVAAAGSAASENPYRFDAVDGDQVVSGKTPFLSRFCGGLCAIVGLLGVSIGTLASSGFGAVGIVAAFVGSIGLLRLGAGTRLLLGPLLFHESRDSGGDCCHVRLRFLSSHSVAGRSCGLPVCVHVGS